MRTPKHHGARTLATSLAVAALVAACSTASVPTPVPTVAPTPVITPDPHMTDPATADEVLVAMGAAGLHLTPNNAAKGGERDPFVKRINATYLGWPLSVSQYRSTKALAKATAWKPDERPGKGDAPVSIAGLNILIEWGPVRNGKPRKPTGAQVDGLRDLVAVADRLLAPVRARSVVALPADAFATSAGSSAAPSDDTKTTPAP